MIRVRAANGAVLVSLGPSFGQWLPYDQIPPEMRAAMIAVEDKRFRSHIGVDPIGVAARRSRSAIDTGRWAQGGSTITQQLARNIFLTNSRTFGRKIKEGVLALALERKFSKDQILELYLNRVYFGGGAYGIDAASRRFFGHSADHLSLGEAAIIAGLVKAPSNYSPTADVEAARDALGRRAADDGRERLRQRRRAASGRSGRRSSIQPTTKQNSVRYFTDWALPQLDTLIDETQRADRRLDDARPGHAGGGRPRDRAPMPRRARRARWSRSTATARCGRWSAARDYVDSIYNRATQAERQPGSAFKLFVYLAALESGMKPTDTIVDEPVTIDGWTPAQLDPHQPRPGHACARPSRARSTRSAPRSARSSASATIADMARRFGITHARSRPIPSMVLGTSDVRLIDMTRAFASVANQGVAVTPYAIRKVVTADGRLLYQHEQRRGARAGRALGRGGNDRPAAVGGADRHRPRRADRPAGRRQDRHHQLQQGRLVHRLFERPHDRRVDGPRRCPADRRACRAAPRRRARSTIS